MFTIMSADLIFTTIMLKYFFITAISIRDWSYSSFIQHSMLYYLYEIWSIYPLGLQRIQ